MKDLAFLVFLRVGDDHLEHEAVDLGFGQGIGALLLDGVLCRHDEEWLLEFESALANGHLTLLHGLEEGTLHLGGGSVDFVGEDKVGEDGTFLDLEGLVLLTVNHGADEVGGQQVGGELYAAEFCIDGLGERCDSQCLGQAWDTLEQHVPVGEEPYHEAFHHVFLTNDILAHLHDQGIHEGTLLFDAGIKLLDIYGFVHIMEVLYIFGCFSRFSRFTRLFRLSRLSRPSRISSQKNNKQTACPCKILLCLTFFCFFVVAFMWNPKNIHTFACYNFMLKLKI